ncbi:RagB/SusD family nutrient uptake outer membrane protein [Desertivirga arenae]|uniref:RagB/SusD family nutrient uptake outer membrane protein n=1 Tax=Desertivirga arenae TaxID=2810309 RepID=UPI001A9764ED|nr:RagB/SusD family nutrient uptake outer membrane protein [Pedobacter sp. SYSU D00823]
MRIKNIILFSLIAAAIGTSSCNKDFLDKDPLKDPSSGTFWTSEADAQAALAGVYGRLQANFMGYQRVYLDGLSDNAYGDPQNSFLPNIAQLTTGGINAGLGSGSPIGVLYSTPYRIVTSCNYFLDNIDKAPISETNKNVYKGEVRFIRALAYFDLVRAFGGVVIYDRFPETLESAKIAKSSREQVYAFIEQDLDFAITNLPVAKYNGHAVKGSAQALKAKVLMTQRKWAEAVPLLQAVIDSKVFGLANDYAGIFKTAGQANANVNKEIIFSTQYLAPNNIQRALNGMDLELGNYALLQPYKDLADDYEMIDGKLPSESPLYNPANPYANRDPRLDLTMKLPNEIWKTPSGATFTPANISSTGFMMEKYVDLSRTPFQPATTANQTDQDYVHLRYADVLLMYAEAKNEVSGPDATVYGAIDEIRARVGMPAVDRIKYNSQALLRDYIRHERRVELALEGERYNDLKRWNIAHIKLPTLKTPAGTSLVFDQKHYTLPFLQFELDNNPQLVQNDDY